MKISENECIFGGRNYGGEKDYKNLFELQQYGGMY